MILIFLLSLISSLFSVLYLYKNINISNKKVKIIIYFLIVFFSTSSIYLLRSNYWLGENIFKKIKNDISIQDANNIKPGSINKIISFLEEDLKTNPKKIETIKKLAEIKYILSPIFQVISETLDLKNRMVSGVNQYLDAPCSALYFTSSIWYCPSFKN